MTLTKELARGMRGLERITQGSFTWNNAEYPIVPGSAVRGKTLELGGFKPTADLTFVARAAALPTPGPEPTKTILFGGNKYRIDSVTAIPGGLLRFKCSDANQGV